ncbi:MAG: CoA-binding protein [Rhodospirillaceae bacterium]
MTTTRYDNDVLKEILSKTKIIAVVGASPDSNRDSHEVMAFLQRHGYRTIPVNPKAAGTIILGETVYPDLASIPVKIDLVDIFRNSEAAGAAVDEAIAVGADTVWMQLGVRNDKAAARAEAAGLNVVMDLCIKIEYRRLYGP